MKSLSVSYNDTTVPVSCHPDSQREIATGELGGPPVDMSA